MKIKATKQFEVLENTYFMKIYCTNCTQKGTSVIEKGYLVKEWLENRECPNCGCDTLVANFNLKDHE